MASRLEIRVEGRVQGVAFRWHTRKQALAYGLQGTVRNLRDGSVAIVAEGNRGALERLLAWAATGPPHAQVVTTEVRWAEARGDFSDFLITG